MFEIARVDCIMPTGISGRTLYPNFTFRKRYGNAHSSLASSCKKDTGVFPCRGLTKTFFLSITNGIFDTRAVSFEAVMCIFKASSVKTNGGSFPMIFSDTVTRFLFLRNPFQKNVTVRYLIEHFK